MTRESWLLEATKLLKTDFATIESEIPGKVHVTCGWPSTGGRAGKRQTIGECWQSDCSEEGFVEIFINPMISDSIEVLGTLVHELVHACGHKGHQGQFRVLAQAIGLEGKMTTSTVGETLMVRLKEITAELGDYPHAKLVPKSQKTQGTRMLKLQCGSCGWMARTSRKWMDLGLPTCACGTQMKEA